MNTTGIIGYRDYLVRRDGDADLLNRKLASREEFFADLEAAPVRSDTSCRSKDRSSGTSDAGGPNQGWTGTCCFCSPPPS